MQKYTYKEIHLAHPDAQGDPYVYLASEVHALRAAALEYMRTANEIIERLCQKHGERINDDPEYNDKFTALAQSLKL